MLNRQKPTQQVLMLIRLAQPETKICQAQSGVLSIRQHVKGGDDDVVITGTSHTAPGNPVALAKHTAKEEFAAMGKGKGKTDLSSFVNLSAQELHSGFLNCL